jgi:hypothetical protein
MAAFSTLMDDFLGGGGINSVKWINSWNDAGYSKSQTGKILTLTPSSVATGSCGIYSNNGYDFTGGAVYMKVDEVPNVATTCYMSFIVSIDANNSFEMQASQGNLYFKKTVTGSVTDISNTAYSSSTHAWWRIRESSGTVYFDTSTDGSSWTNRESTAVGITLTNMATLVTVGNWQIQASSGIGRISNFNMVPSGYMFKEDFESGALPALFDYQLASATNTIVIDNTSKISGTYSAKTTRAATGYAYLYKTIVSAAEIYVKFKIKLASDFSQADGDYFTLLSIQDAVAAEQFYLNIEDSTNTLYFGGTGLTGTDTGITLTAGTTTTIQIYYKENATTGSVKIWVNSAAQATPTYSSGDINSGTTSFITIGVGGPWIYGTNADSWYIDDIYFNENYIIAGSTSNSGFFDIL